LRDYPKVRIGKLHYSDARAVLDATSSWLLRKVEARLQSSPLGRKDGTITLSTYAHVLDGQQASAAACVSRALHR